MNKTEKEPALFDPTKGLSLSEKIKVWKASGLDVRLSQDAIDDLDRSVDAVVNGCEQILLAAQKEKRRALWLTVVQVVCFFFVVLVWALQ